LFEESSHDGGTPIRIESDEDEDCLRMDVLKNLLEFAPFERREFQDDDEALRAEERWGGDEIKEAPQAEVFALEHAGIRLLAELQDKLPFPSSELLENSEAALTEEEEEILLHAEEETISERMWQDAAFYGLEYI
jgi:hypothetical protein